MDDLQTEVNSPSRKNHQKYLQHHSHAKRSHLNVQNLEPTSETQKQLFSRQLVREIMQKEKNKTVRHQIGKIDRNSTLYAKPQTSNPGQFNFDSIPAQNPSYSSLGSAKIQEINKGLKTRPTTASVWSVKRIASKNKTKDLSNSNSSFKRKEVRVAVSGLATYKFYSVNAERSLGFNRINHDQKLNEQLKKSNRYRDCSRNRFKNILQKQSQKRFKEHLRRQQLIMPNFQHRTDNYIEQIKEENQKEEFLYGEKMKKLTFIKDYMAFQHTSYQEGKHIVNEIKRCRTQYTTKRQPSKVLKTQKDEDQQLERRKIPIIKKQLKVRYLTFVQ